MTPFHPFVQPFTYFPDWDEVRDAAGRTVLRLSGAGSKGVDVEDWRDAQSVRDRIGSHIAELMNASAVLAEHEEKV